ncbi:MAG TPA: N-acetylglucosamine kinase [Cytophagales bacterium]|jgi:glucosamine kinase|nr:N-acetylglucosamine kinase [Cytophagales bacterium]
MIIIADSGGSKIDWRFLTNDGRATALNSAGYNPYYQPIDHLQELISKFVNQLPKEEVTHIFYYGTGVSSDKNVEVITGVVATFFPKAKIEVSWDLLAAARSLCGNKPGIACILGTGSNSCLYDGEKIIGNVANLGWILADEGSGTFLGKRLVFDFFRKEMPVEVALKFQAEFRWSREEVLERVYQKEKPSAFLASFAKFISKNIDQPYCYQLAYQSLGKFLKNNVMKYEGFEKIDVHFTGSISFHFRDVLIQLGKDMNIKIKNISEGPIEGLTSFHKKEVNQMRSPII